MHESYCDDAVVSERVMYVKPGCPYCAQAREALTADGVEFEERDATLSPEWKAELFRHTKNTGMVPTIVGPDGVQVGWQGKG
jgi:glutaredoxin